MNIKLLNKMRQRITLHGKIQIFHKNLQEWPQINFKNPNNPPKKLP